MLREQKSDVAFIGIFSVTFALLIAFLIKSSERNVINLKPPDFKPSVKIFGKGKAVF